MICGAKSNHTATDAGVKYPTHPFASYNSGYRSDVEGVALIDERKSQEKARRIAYRESQLPSMLMRSLVG